MADKHSNKEKKMQRKTPVTRRPAALMLLSCWVLVGDITDPLLTAATTYYVATQGNVQHTCTDAQSPTTPKATIVDALSCLSAGDTLFITAGTYEEAIDSNKVTIPTGASWDNAVTIAAMPGDHVILRPRGSSEVINLAHPYIQYIVFDRLTLDAMFISGHGLSLNNGAHHIRFKNGEIKNAPHQGILLTNGSGVTRDNEFINLNVHNNGRGRLSHGIYISTSNNLIERSDIHHNAGYGIHIYSDDGGVNGNVVRFNIARNNSTHDCCSAGILVGSGDGNIAYGNIAYENPQGIVVGHRGATNTHVYNNTVYNNSNGGILIKGSSSRAVVANNIVYLNQTPIENFGSGSVLKRNLTVDPKFVDSGRHDFSLRAGSTAIDAGIPVSQVTEDIAGTLRPQGAGYDIGAYEYTP